MLKHPVCLALAATFLLAGSPLTAAEAKSPGAKNAEAQSLAVLKSNASRKEKADACMNLARVATKESVPVLAGLLPDPELSHMARYALEPLPDPSVDAALRDAAGKLNGNLLAGVIGSVGVRRSPQGDKLLAGFLNNPDPVVAEAAARALGRFTTPLAVRSLQTALTNATGTAQLAICEGLFRIAEGLTAQAKLPEAAAVYHVLRALPNAPAQVRSGALRGAILTRGPAAAPLLREALRCNDLVLVDAALRAAMELPGAEITTLLASELPRTTGDKQMLLIQTLGWRSDPAALSALATVAASGTASVRLAAVRAIGQLVRPAAVPSLAGWLDDADRPVAQAAQDALAAIPGAAADDAVAKLMKDASPARRQLGIDLAGRRKSPSSLPTLWECASDADGAVRAAALRRISELTGPEDLPKLLDLLAKLPEAQDPVPIAQALGRLAERSGNPEAAAGTLSERYPSLIPAQQAALLSTFAALGGPKSLEVVRTAWKSPNAALQTAALEALADWKSFDAAPDLAQIATAGGKSEFVATAFGGCARLCAEADAPAQLRLQTITAVASVATEPAQKKRLLSALGEVPAVGALALVTPYLTQQQFVNEAGAAVVKICSRLDASAKAEAGTALNLVLKTSKSRTVLDGTRKQMERLGIQPE